MGGPELDVGRMLRLPAGSVHVAEAGPLDGPVVVLLHGFASSLHSFDRVASILAADRRVIRVDLLGHGRSPQLAPDYGSDGQAAVVGAVLDDLHVQPETAVGHSFGADSRSRWPSRAGGRLAWSSSVRPRTTRRRGCPAAVPC